MIMESRFSFTSLILEQGPENTFVIICTVIYYPEFTTARNEATIYMNHMSKQLLHKYSNISKGAILQKRPKMNTVSSASATFLLCDFSFLTYKLRMTISTSQLYLYLSHSVREILRSHFYNFH